MQTSFSDKIAEVGIHIEQGDLQLGLRRFLDCALDTENPAIFSRVLATLDRLEANPEAGTAAIMEIIQPVLEELKHVTLTSPGYTGIVKTDGLGKTYSRGNFSLKNVSFAADAGEIVGLVGENGNGKTTLLRLLAKDLEPGSGSIQYDFVAQHVSPYELRTRLVYIPQRIPRWFGSLMDNLQFTLTLHGKKGEENRLWAEMMVARLNLRPYKHLDWSRISSGYKTRFELAKNLLRKPVLFLLDEPLANLDILAQQTILQDLRHLSQSHTRPFAAVLSSQQLFEVEKVSDLVIFLRNGEPRYQHRAGESQPHGQEMIFEMETSVSKEKLMAAFAALGIQRIVNNGGVYLSHFPPGTTHTALYRAMADSGITFNYIRDISQSSRRYFAD